MSPVATSRRGRPGGATWATIGLAAALGAGACSEEAPPKEAPRSEPEQNRREEFRWVDRLNEPPFAADDAAPDEAVERWVRQLLEVPVERGADALDQAAAIEALGAPLPAMLRALETTEDPGRRVAIVRAAASRGDAAAVLLCRALRLPPTEVGLLAARALGELRVPWTLPRLIKELGQYDAHPDLIVRVEAAAALLRCGNYSGVPMLIKVLKEHTRLQDDRDREWPARTRVAFEKETAWRALAPFLGEGLRFSPNAPYEAQADVVEAVEARFADRRVQLWEDSPALDDEGLRRIVDRLVDGFLVFQIRNVDNARFTLSHLGPKVVPALLPHLGSPHVYIRVHVLEVLETVGPLLRTPDPLIDPVCARLEDDDAAVRSVATRVLGALDHPRALDAVVRSLDDPDPSVRITAIQALGAHGDDRTDALLAAIAAEPRGDAWAAANAALWRRGQAARVDPLLDALLDGDLGVRAAALDQLLWIGADTSAFPLTGGLEARRPAAEAVRASVPRG